MRKNLPGALSVVWFIVMAFAIDAIAGSTKDGTLSVKPHSEVREWSPGDIETPRPPLSEGIFPCSNCHSGMTVNPRRRKLTDEHAEIVFEHDAKNRWCLDCHNANDRDKLRMASGATIDFSKSYLLCGQCHGPTFRDWKAGVHGKRTGSWNGKKTYYLCVHCHNPHSPRVKPIAPFPAPPPPQGKPLFSGGSDK
jgi:uncharacterized CHY-type Zn-finger protein